jgi:hypothetical protein
MPSIAYTASLSNDSLLPRGVASDGQARITPRPMTLDAHIRA